jgi:hypothetical protein
MEIDPNGDGTNQGGLAGMLGGESGQGGAMEGMT